MQMGQASFYVYIAASRTRVLYLGITRNLKRRMHGHRDPKNEEIPAFALRNRCNRLVWFENHVSPESAIARETQLKSWSRAQKLALVANENPSWNDFSENSGKAKPVKPLRELGSR
ncbi:GIY-YIG nuclease family protein [Alloacidobacterium dinghuense]|uniref:GIY-YIG nuclease family protein n=1 Tax=Alloacidobacterium dinghuense TaxID=2763107 RepID=A0A7G8BI22_9BACT|nr:GIY-YIG nuclease family protein [Alloacidobacterium dinghuense]QNI32192.1 GIY-YIG nuclease family protein [Alloacidobacterium dinghuense]